MNDADSMRTSLQDELYMEFAMARDNQPKYVVE